MKKCNAILLITLLVLVPVLSNAATLNIEENMQRTGSDYTNFITGNVTECANACAGDSRCLAFDYSRHDSRCWLKNRVPNPRYNPDVVSGTKTISPTAKTTYSGIKRVPGMRIELNTQRAMGDYTNFPIAGAEECAWECVNDPRCKAFDYGKHDSRCWLKDTVPQARPNGDVISGVKLNDYSGYPWRQSNNAWMEIEQNTQRAFSDYTNFNVTGVNECARYCLNDTGCLAFDYSRHDSRCWLKNRVPHPRYNADVVAGVKRWGGRKNRKRHAAVGTRNHRYHQVSKTRKFDTRVLAAQKMLKRLGYRPGPTDGTLGRKTKTAVRNFQREHDLPATGSIDQATYQLLVQLNAPPAGY